MSDLDVTVVAVAIDLLLILAFYLPMATGTLFILPIGCMGTGAYAAALLAMGGQSLPVILLGGAVVGAIVALLGGSVLVRMAPWSGAIASLGMVMVLQSIYSNSPAIGGSTGLLGVPPYTTSIVCYILAGAAVVILVVLELGRFGDVLEAIRTDTVAAEASGIRIVRVRMAVFGVSGVLAGLSGALTAGFLGIVDPDSFGLNQVNRALIGVVIGGDTSALGSLIGATILNIVPQIFANFSDFSLLFLSIVVIVVLLVRPEGVISRRLLKRFVRFVSKSMKRRKAVSASEAPSTSAHQARFLRSRPRWDRLQATGMAKAYSGLKVVCDVDLDVGVGEVLGIIGPNGAGKTTFIDLITGVTRSDAGEVKVSAGGVTRTRRRMRPTVSVAMGMSRTFQSGRLFPGLSARAHVTMMRGADANAILDLVGLHESYDAPVGELSYGAQRLVSIARALASSPSFLLLDEPTAGMTNEEARGVGELVGRLADSGVGVVIIDHNVDFMAKTCDSLMFMSFGEVLASGDPTDVLRKEVVVNAYFGESDERLAGDDGAEGIVEEIAAEGRE